MPSVQEFPEEVGRARAAVGLHSDQIAAVPNVVGCFVGRRTVAGRRTDEPAVVVFVSHKLPRR